MSWPWMKDAKIWDQATLPPDRNGRDIVAELIQENAKSILELRSAIQDDPLFDPNKHDDLWLLRFLLSHNGKVVKAVKACNHTLRFRHTHQLDAADIRFQPPSKLNPKTKRFMEYAEDSAFGFDIPDPTRGVITYLHLAGIDSHGLIANVADGDVQSFFIFITEWSHQWLDYVTRTTGLLTKAIRTMDVKGMTLAKMNRESLKRNARYIDEMEDCYPQLLQSVFPCHAPAVLQGLWTTFRPLFPTRLVRKLDFINPEHVPKDLQKLLQHVDKEHLPERFGGMNKTWPVRVNLPPINNH